MEHSRPRPEQECRVQVALHGPIVTDLVPGIVDRNSPVSSNNIAAGFGHLTKDRRRPGSEVNGRDAAEESLENHVSMWKREFAVVGRVQRADPGVEQLDRVDTRLDL